MQRTLVFCTAHGIARNLVGYVINLVLSDISIVHHHNASELHKVQQGSSRVTGQRGRWRLSSARHSTREMSSHRRPLHPPPHRTLTLPPPRPRHTHVTAGFEQWQVWLPATVCTLYRVELKNCCNTRILPTNRPPTYDPLLVCLSASARHKWKLWSGSFYQVGHLRRIPWKDASLRLTRTM